ncbi:MAG: multicopper oxidase domain-containing protein [Eubacteriales bacterium]
MKLTIFKNYLNQKLLNRVLVGVISLSMILGVGGAFIIPSSAIATGMNPGGVPDYFGTVPNYANSPLPELDASGNIIPGTGIRKFVDSLPGLGKANANNLGNFIPVAIPDTTTYPGSDYYEINLVEYSQQFNTDLPATKLRGYVQVNTTDPAISKPSYLGPMIIAQKDRPVRVKFTNKLPIGAGGDLFIPVDTTMMGAGIGPNGVDSYTENRATLHLHGGLTPWISDGNAHQWITPANEKTPYPEGVSVHNVPDMPDPGPGSMTFFYTNQQSARLMWYHDHAYGLTRLNVYVGEAAPYLLRDDTEKALIASGDIPTDEIPLIIQDKTFVPKTPQLAQEDPTWDLTKWGGYGSLWFPHVYMTNQNPYDNSGANTMGRWDYGPWFWPPYTGLEHGPVANPLAGINGEPPMNPGVPNVSQVPEAFMDTPVVNGVAYPYLEVQPKAYRLRILNAANDRFFNLQLYTAKANTQMWSGTTLLSGDAGEVSMVDAVKKAGYPSTWPTDGREGGVPDPATVGPSMIQIGTEAGILPAPAELPNQPIGYVYNRRDIVVLNVADKTLFLGPAERADVVVDFSKYAGQTLILYNDAPAPVPAFDPRNDYYTGDPDQTSSGGAPTTLPGYGPNTRTVMQIKVAAATAPTGTKIAQINLTSGGSGYTAPTVAISPPLTQAGAPNTSGTTATAKASSSIDQLTLTNPGAGFTVAPAVAFVGGSPTTIATANATMSVTGINLIKAGVGYKSTPIVTIKDSLGGTGTGATAQAVVNTVTGKVTGISLMTPGAGYTAPVVTITGGGPTTLANMATASVTGLVDGIKLVNAGAGYTSAPTVAFAGGNPTTQATANANLRLIAINLTNGGSGYMNIPVVTITDATGTGATANAIQGDTLTLLNNSIPAAFAKSQNPLIVPDGTYVRIQDTSIKFTPPGTTTQLTLPLAPKAIQELFTTDYGRMNSTFGVELPLTNFTNQTTIPLGYLDPATEVLQDSVTPMSPVAGDGTQIWKITHNGVDTHAIHFHLFDVQLINRVGWDGAVRPPDANEQGWKDTIRMNPLEDCIVAFRPVAPKMNFGIPDSIRPLDPTSPLGTSMQFTQIDPLTGNTKVVTNVITNFGWEYVWHCHLLGHEENDMMRPMILNVARKLATAPVLTATRNAGTVNLAWTDATPANALTSMGNPASEIGFNIERAAIDKNKKIGTYSTIGAALANQTNYQDLTAGTLNDYSYRVTAFNAAGNSSSIPVTVVAPPAPPVAPTGLAATLQSGPRINLIFQDNATNETGFTLERSVNGGAFATLTSLPANNNTGSVTYSDSAIAQGSTYTYRVAAVNSTFNFTSAYATSNTITTPTLPAAPSALAGTYAAGNGNRYNVNLTWTDNANNETGFTLQRANNSSFTNNQSTSNLNTNAVSTQQTGLSRATTYYFRIQSVNSAGVSAWSNVAIVAIP